jgi:uncharacterized protein (DUF1778 family)
MINQKEERLNIRVSPKQKEVISLAAQLTHTTVSAFVVNTAYLAAEEVLTNQSEFILSKSAWDQFCAALDAPPKELPKLKKLLTEPSIFERTDSAQTLHVMSSPPLTQSRILSSASSASFSFASGVLYPNTGFWDSGFTVPQVLHGGATVAPRLADLCAK